VNVPLRESDYGVGAGAITVSHFDDRSGLAAGGGRSGARRFRDAREAGRALAAALIKYEGRDDVFVLALASGGVHVAAEVAARLGAPLDVVLIRRLFMTRGVGDPVCAFVVGGILFLDEGVPPRADSPASGAEFFLADALDGLARRERECRGARPPVELARRTVLLVDNGVYTGSTMLAAVRAVRAFDPARVVAAAPVASPESVEAVEAATDEFVRLECPHQFGHVGMWYEKFERPDEARIRETLDGAARGG
jgi:putative phosphoribosyl transferase